MDFDEILRLLQVTELSTKWPELRPIHDAAYKALLEHVAGHKAPKAIQPIPQMAASARGPFTPGGVRRVGDSNAS